MRSTRDAAVAGPQGGWGTPRAIRALLLGVLVAGCRYDSAGFEDYGGGDDATHDGADEGGDGSGPPDASAPPPPPGPDAAPPPVPVRFGKTLTILAGRVGEDLVDFPVYVALTDDDLRQRASASGADLHFVAADGVTALDHEVQRWDPATGRLEAWVRLPAITAAADTSFELRYGAFAAPPAPNPAGVWKNGFLAVWHLEEQPTGQAGDVKDATGARPARSSGMNAAAQIAGQLGGALAFDGGNDQLTFTNPLTGASPHTISAWVRQSTSADNDALVVLGDGACTRARWLHTRFSGAEAAAGFYCDDFTDTGMGLPVGSWALVHWTYDAEDTSVLYHDGAAAASHAHAGTQSTTGTTGRIGNAPGPFGQGMGLHGDVDEVRLADVARAPAWIAAEHANQAAPADFVSVGAEEPLP